MDNSWILESTVLSNEIYGSSCQEGESQPFSFECDSWPLIAWSQWRGDYKGWVQLGWVSVSFPAAGIWHDWVLLSLARAVVCIQQRGAVLLNEDLPLGRATFCLRTPRKSSLPSGSSEGWRGECFCCLKPYIHSPDAIFLDINSLWHLSGREVKKQTCSSTSLGKFKLPEQPNISEVIVNDKIKMDHLIN